MNCLLKSVVAHSRVLRFLALMGFLGSSLVSPSFAQDHSQQNRGVTAAPLSDLLGRRPITLPTPPDFTQSPGYRILMTSGVTSPRPSATSLTASSVILRQNLKTLVDWSLVNRNAYTPESLLSALAVGRQTALTRRSFDIDQMTTNTQSIISDPTINTGASSTHTFFPPTSEGPGPLSSSEQSRLLLTQALGSLTSAHQWNCLGRLGDRFLAGRQAQIEALQASADRGSDLLNLARRGRAQMACSMARLVLALQLRSPTEPLTTWIPASLASQQFSITGLSQLVTGDNGLPEQKVTITLGALTTADGHSLPTTECRATVGLETIPQSAGSPNVIQVPLSFNPMDFRIRATESPIQSDTVENLILLTSGQSLEAAFGIDLFSQSLGQEIAAGATGSDSPDFGASHENDSLLTIYPLWIFFNPRNPNSVSQARTWLTHELELCRNSWASSTAEVPSLFFGQ